MQRGLELDGVYYEIPVWNHGGNTMAFSSAFWVLPEQDFAISILSSGYGTDFNASVYTAIRTLVDDLPAPVEVPEYVIDTSRYVYHVGEYMDEWNVGPATVSPAPTSAIASSCRPATMARPCSAHVVRPPRRTWSAGSSARW